MELINVDYSFIEQPDDYKEAAVGRNPLVKWVKFVFTDDQPNANKWRIPKAEFSSVIKTGINMPIKMEASNPNGGHMLSTPIGVITNLIEQDNKVIGLAALWKDERPDDIEMLEKAYASKEPLKLSWEVYHSDVVVDEKSGIEDFIGVTVKATTFVGNPAYQGRTNVVAMSESQSAQEDNTLTETKIQELEDQIAKLTSDLDAAKSELSNKNSEFESQATELKNLREYKSERETTDAKAELAKSRRTALSEAGVKLSEDEFNSRLDRILAMDEETFGFYAQELVAFSSRNTSTTEPASSGASTSQIPNVSSSTPKDPKSAFIGAFK